MSKHISRARSNLTLGLVVLGLLLVAVVLGNVGSVRAPRESISVVALGDIMLGRHVGELIAQGVDPFQYIRFDNRSFPHTHDIVMANLEGPITTATDCQEKAYSFKFVPETAMMLKNRGITAVSMANNHSQDCYSQGFADTQKYLKEAGVAYFGGFSLSNISREIVVRGIHVALVGLDMTVGPPPSKAVYDKIAELKQRNTFVIVNIHWGDEYAPTPNAQQVSVGHKLVDAGVDLVIGNHPHVVEPIETYKGKTIFYSLGNFIFDQTDPEAKKGMFPLVTLYADGKQTYKTFTYHIEHSQPRLD